MRTPSCPLARLRARSRRGTPRGNPAALHARSGVTRMCRFACAALLIAHWLACGLHLVAQFEGADCNWISSMFALQRGEPPCGGIPLAPDERPSVGAIYVAALLWSMQTATTVGYGDVAAQTTAERAYVILAMLAGGGFFSYVVGSFVSVLASLGEREAAMAATMDSVNSFIGVASLPPELSGRLRAYFRFQHRTLTALSSWRPLLDAMSPALRGDVALALHAGWISRLSPFFARAPESLLIELSFAFRPLSFPPGELLACLGEDATRGTLMVVTRGCVAVRAPGTATERLRFAGLLVGEEALWPSRRIAATVLSVTPVDVQAIRVDTLLALIDGFPAFQKHARRVALCHWLRARLAEVVAGVRRVHAALAEGARRDPGRAVPFAELLAAARATPAGATPPAADGICTRVSSGNLGGPARLQGRTSTVLAPRDAIDDGRGEERAHHGAAARATDALALLILSRAAPEAFAAAERAAQRLQRVWRGAFARHRLRAALSAGGGRRGAAAAAWLARAEREAAVTRRSLNAAAADPHLAALAELVTHDVLEALRPQLSILRAAVLHAAAPQQQQQQQQQQKGKR